MHAAVDAVACGRLDRLFWPLGRSHISGHFPKPCDCGEGFVIAADFMIADTSVAQAHASLVLLGLCRIV